MKRLSLLIIISLGALGCNAQKLDVSKVPAAVKNSFEKTYPGTVAKWEKEDGNYEVNFKQNEHTMSVTINANGMILETEMDIKTTELPAAVLTYLKDHYKGRTIKEAARITKAAGDVNYEAEIGSTDLIFDANGKFIKEAKD